MTEEKSFHKTNYNTEKLEELEREKRKRIASKLLLKDEDSNLVKVLSGFNEDAVNEVISSVSDRAISNFGERWGQDVILGISLSLTSKDFVEQIQTLEDFRRYAYAIMELANILTKRDKEGNVISGVDFRTIERFASVMPHFFRDNFDRDLNTMLQILSDNPSSFSMLCTDISVLEYCAKLIETSDDFELFAQFWRFLTEKGIDPESFLSSISFYSLSWLFYDISIKEFDLIVKELRNIAQKAKPNTKLHTFASKFLQQTLYKLYEEEKFGIIRDIQKYIDGASETLEEVDQYIADKLSYQDLISKIPYLGDSEVNMLFPKTFSKVREMIFTEFEFNEDLADYFVENLSNYYKQSWVEEGVRKAIQWWYSVAKKFIDAVEEQKEDWVNAPWVENILKEAQAIINQGPPHDEWDDEGEYYHAPESEGFKSEDPYINHPYRVIRSSLGLGRIMAGKIKPEESSLELSPEAIEALKEINEILIEEHEKFLEKFKNSPFVPGEDKLALISPNDSKVKMNNLLPNVRNFIGRYLAQLSEGDVKRLNEVIISQKDKIRDIIKKGYEKYLKIYEIDIPLYDKLYDEFDRWREAGRYPLEVYLGRDGVYAYIGRRAQDAGRRSKVGKERRIELREGGEIIEIHPKYLIYPRYFRDYIKPEVKRAFLEQERIFPEMDPLFYDTGYTGTIPEQIMRIMNFDSEEIDQRIRLLSAQEATRRVRGIPENVRSQIIEYIEHNAKIEKSAEGLLFDSESGKIRPIAKPEDPEEQFYFMMIKQAIARHYFIKEKLHFEVPENVNYETEDYYIRIRQKYIELLPEGFITDPKKYLEEHGKLLKGSKGKGEYPDEEVLCFKLKDGTEVIAKRVELRKAKEERKEFMVLLAAKKAGLPTAEPIGFLSGKKKEDGSYVLMEKIEGYSGRKFRKYLEDSNKFTEEQIIRIMKTVAEKLHELAELFREKLNIDKRWRIKDTIIQFNEETGEVENVIPIDWERVTIYDPNKPKKIDVIE